MATEVLKARIRWGVALVVALGIALGAVLSERIEERRATRIEERARVEPQPQPPGPSPDFESSWETCTGTASNCVQDGGTWDQWQNVGWLEVFSGGGAHPQAIDGSNILALWMDGSGNDYTALTEDAFFGLTEPDNYLRLYFYVPTTANLGGFVPHWFENDPFFGGATIFHLRYVSATPSDLTVGYLGPSSGACGIERINQDSTPDFRIDTGKWYRYEQHIECPNNDDCLNTGFRANANVRVHFQIYEVTNIATGTEVLVADDAGTGAASPMIVHDYGAGYSSAGWPLAHVYDGTEASECVRIHGGDPSFIIGPNGATGGATGLRIGTYVDAVAHCTTDWCGSIF